MKMIPMIDHNLHFHGKVKEYWYSLAEKCDQILKMATVKGKNLLSGVSL